MRNREVAKLLEDIADVLEVKGEGSFRVRAYREAARRIDGLADSIEDIAAEGKLDDVPGIGPSIAQKVVEYLSTGHSSYFEDQSKDLPPGLPVLLQVPGIGPSRVRQLYDKLGIKSIEELESSAREHRIRDLPGMGEKTEANILKEVERWRQRTKRMLLGEALPAAEDMISRLRDHPAIAAIDTAGSIRRWKETIGDIDILAASDHPEEVIAHFTKLSIVKEVIAKGATKSSVLTAGDLQIDLRVVDPLSYGAALQYFTGSKSHNIALRDIAIRKGYKLSEYGVFDEESGRKVAGKTEEEIYSLLGMDYIVPELRENQGEIEAALQHNLPKLIELSDIKGDLHVHTVRSDGAATLEDMAVAARDRGYEYIAVCNHSKSLGVARGLSVEELAEEREEVKQLNAKLSPFRILSGIEMDILADGALDYPDEILADFDIVTVSVHSAFGQPKEKITERIERAISNPFVSVLNHPTGRLIGRRDPYEVDIDAVLHKATGTGTAFEINASPDRLDLDDVSARKARRMGLMLAINTDAHAPGHYSLMRYGVATARRGWVEPEGVLNTQPLKQLLKTLEKRKKQALKGV